MAGLFDTFTIAKRGLSVQQQNINVNAHNIANVKTEGYSRQRAITETTRPFGGNSKFDMCSAGQIGTGAQVTSIIRIRNKFIDYQYRNENGALENNTVKSDFLSKVEDIFNEPSDTSLQSMFSEFYSAFQEVVKQADKSEAKTVAVQKASALANQLNSVYTKLEDKLDEAQLSIEKNVKDVNMTLDQINELNQQISRISTLGMNANDLMDTRDNLLDKLSGMMGIVVENDKRDTINLKVEAYTNPGNPIKNMINSSPSDENYTRFSYVKSTNINADGKLEVEYCPLGDTSAQTKTIVVEGGSTDLKELQTYLNQNRMLIGNKNGVVGKYNNSGDFEEYVEATPISISDIKKSVLQLHEKNEYNSVDNKNIKGSIAGNQAIQNDLKNYMSDLDKIAATLAYSVNAILTGNDGNGTDNYDLLFINDSESNITDSGVSAKTIRVNEIIVKDVSKLNCKAKETDAEKNSDRAQAIADLVTIKFDISSLNDIKNLTRKDFFIQAKVNLDDNKIGIKGYVDGKATSSYYNDMINTLGTNAEEANRKVTNQEVLVANLENQRLSESGVSLDEEMSDMIQFQHAYQANAKMISTIDELLDVVINGLKR